MVGDGLLQRHVGGGEDHLEEVGPYCYERRNAEDIDHGRHHDEAAADPHDGGQEADEQAHHEGKEQRRSDPRLLEFGLERPSSGKPGQARRTRLLRHGELGAELIETLIHERADVLVPGGAHPGAHRFPDHQAAHRAKHDDVDYSHPEVEVAHLPQITDDLYAHGAAQQAPAQYRGAQLDVDVAQPRMGQGA